MTARRPAGTEGRAMTSQRLRQRGRAFIVTPMRAIVVLAVLVVAVSSTTVALGAIGDSGTVTACVLRSNGTWHLITSGTCKSSEDTVQLYTKSGADAEFMPMTNCMGFPHIGIDWHDCNLAGANLIGQNLSNANLSGANLIGANLSSAILLDTNLSGADLTGAVVSAVIWTDATCPDGTSANDGVPLPTCEGHL